MTNAGASRAPRALAVQTSRELSDSHAKPRSLRSAPAKQWQPPEGLAPHEILAIIDAASTERDRLLLRVLWATGARISEALELRVVDVRRDSLVLPNLKNPSRLTKQVFLPAGQMDLPGAATVGQGTCPYRWGAALLLTQAWPCRRAAADQSSTGVGDCAHGCGKKRTYVSWRCVVRAMARQATPRQCILTCSGMRACGRSSVPRKVCPSRKSRAVGADYRWRIFRLATTKSVALCKPSTTNRYFLFLAVSRHTPCWPR